jgi:hypothetical protein
MTGALQWCFSDVTIKSCCRSWARIIGKTTTRKVCRRWYISQYIGSTIDGLSRMLEDPTWHRPCQECLPSLRNIRTDFWWGLGNVTRVRKKTSQ